MAIDPRTKWKAGSRFQYNAELYRDKSGELVVDYQFKPIPETDSDQFHKVEIGEEYRPDLISLRFYGRDDLDWLIMQANDIDSLKGFRSQTTLRIPALASLLGRVV